jgi:Flavodoxin reductases (ferredoxin-NADPH reductases) family 1
MMADWVSGKVTKVEFWTDTLFSLYLRAPVHPFTAGQFTKLGLEIDGERVQRAYSYVNAPGNPDLEFYRGDRAGRQAEPTSGGIEAGR